MMRGVYLTGMLCCLGLSPVLAGEVTVAVASNFLATAKQLGEAFHRSHPHHVSLSAASTGKLFAQIQHGAPYDIFLAADSRRPQLLEASGAVVADSRFTYAIGVLVLVSRVHGDCRASLESGNFSHLAIANPKTAPYGEAAVRVLENLQLWTTLQDKLVFGENIGQTFQYVSSATADLGFVAQAQLQSLTNGDLRCQWQPPEDSYPLLTQQAVLLKRADHNAAAIAFFAYLKSTAARRIIAASGYHLE